MVDENIKWFRELSNEDVAIAGGKGASLGEMYNSKLPIPPGFVVTAQAFKKYIEKTGIKNQIMNKLSKVNIDDTQQLQAISQEIQELVLQTEMLDDIRREVVEAYDNLNVNSELHGVSKNALSIIKTGRDLPFVAVRSSATAEDLPSASFAGQQASFLNIKGNTNVIKAVQMCWASLYTARAIYYRIKNNFPHDKVYIAVVIQKMVNSEKAGVMFSVNPATNNESEIVIEAAYGLGDAVVAGEVSPDNYILDKNNLELKHKLVNKQEWMYARQDLQNIKVNLGDKGKQQKLSEIEIKRLGELAQMIDSHYKRAMDMEFAIEGNKVYIVQARPVTTLKKEKKEETTQKLGGIILEGLGASPGVAGGKVKIVKDMKEINKVEKGDVLVAKMTSPDYVPAMEKASAIVTDEGGLTSHAAIVSREMGVPCIVGTEKATKTLQENQLITVDGSTGKVYDGYTGKAEKVEKKTVEYAHEPIVTATKLYMNLGEPEKIDEYKDLDFDGIGLMRIEFIITSYINEHPNAMIRDGREKEYIEKLAEGIETVAAAINNKPMIVRFSDFKTNEYKNLKGGENYEPHEENPMIGWRGVSRYVSEEFEDAFLLEVKAIAKVRSKGLRNVHVMLPFVRNIDEVKQCLRILKKQDLENGHDFGIYLMAEVPSIALLAEEFAQLNVAGCSIGSNDLTQLTLGVDRDSTKLAKMGYFDERNLAVSRAISMIIHGFKKHGKSVSICGQAPSVYPEVVEFLVKEGIDAISVNPDTVNKTRVKIASTERKLLLERLR